MTEAMTWLVRLLSLLVPLERLWDAAKSQDPQRELEAQLALTRAIKDRQALEEIVGPEAFR